MGRKELFPLPVADLFLVIINGGRTDDSELVLGKGVDIALLVPRRSLPTAVRQRREEVSQVPLACQLECCRF